MYQKIAGNKTITASIHELTDDEVFEIQITENLERKDVIIQICNFPVYRDVLIFLNVVILANGTSYLFIQLR